MLDPIGCRDEIRLLAALISFDCCTDWTPRQLAFHQVAFDKHRLLNGLDDIELTLAFDAEISSFAENYKARRRWAC